LGDPSFDDVARNFREKEEAENARKKEALKKVLVALKADSVNKIIVEWDGHEDDGSIQRVTFVKPDGTQVDQDLNWSTEKNGFKSEAVGTIEDFVFTMVPPGWETNEGGFGTCIIDVKTGDYDFRHIFGRGKPYELRA